MVHLINVLTILLTVETSVLSVPVSVSESDGAVVSVSEGRLVPRSNSIVPQGDYLPTILLPLGRGNRKAQVILPPIPLLLISDQGTVSDYRFRMVNSGGVLFERVTPGQAPKFPAEGGSEVEQEEQFDLEL
ncbi:hypothetical protein FB446DRAFT_793329 [Lentinula raphanica]|nr:hypothetical protein FB446DRAFT_793329 [Lentinula raphanica]